MNTPLCPITATAMQPLFTAKVLGKYDAPYYISPESGLIQTPSPTWLNEAYASAITATDVGLVARNLFHKELLSWLLPFLGLDRGPYLDLGGGYGLLARLMRDVGFDFHTTDPYCQNLFAKNHEPASGFTAQAITTFEVFEHIPDPLTFVRDAFERYQCRTLVFSTLKYGDTPPPLDWWYWCFETGQHITFYNKKSLDLLASKVGCYCFSLTDGFHVITDRQLTRQQRAVLKYRTARKLYDRWTKKRRPARPSLTHTDFEVARARVCTQQSST